MASNTTDKDKAKMLEALEQTKGIVTDACKIAGIHRTTHYLWLKDDPEYKLNVEKIEDVAIDFVESKLFEKIEGVMGETWVSGNPYIYKIPPSDTAIIFYLKTKAKQRGYGEKIKEEKQPDKTLSIKFV